MSAFLYMIFVAKGSLLKIRIVLEKISFSLEAIGKVVWLKEDPVCKRYEVGIEFVNMPKRASKYLIEYIQSVVRHIS